MDENNNINKNKSFSRIIPFVGLFILTILLLYYFKTNSDRSHFLAEGHQAIINFYTDNLQPLVYKTDLSDEDMFNFALYRNLPVDKDNDKILFVDEDNSGDKSFQIKQAKLNKDSKNYENYKKRLKLTEAQSNELDSILNYYKKDIYSYVLVNKNNTVAIDPDLELLRKSIASDIQRFTFKHTASNVSNSTKEFFAANPHPGLTAYKKYVDTREKGKKDFIFFGADTIFKQKVAVNKQHLDHYLAVSEKNLYNDPEAPEIVDIDYALAVKDESENNAFSASLKYEQAVKRATLPADIFTVPEVNVFPPDFSLDSLRACEQTFRLFLEGHDDDAGFTVNMSRDEGSFKFNFDLKDLGLYENFQAGELEGFENLHGFGFSIDSTNNEFKMEFSDSANKFMIDFSNGIKIIQESRTEVKEKAKKRRTSTSSSSSSSSGSSSSSSSSSTRKK